MFSLESVIRAVVYLLVAGLIFSLLWWAVRRLDLPEPFRKVAEVVIVMAAVLAACGVLLSFAGGYPVFRP